MTLTEFLIAGLVAAIAGCGIAWVMLLAATGYVAALTSCGAC